MGNKIKVRTRILRQVLLGWVILAVAGWPLLSAAEVHYRYRVTLKDELGHKGVVMVCAINPERAKEKALAKWGHKAHHPGAVSVVKKGVCQQKPQPA
jgi:hypothetical protein